MLWRVAEKPEASAELKFTDNASIADGFKDAVAWGVENGIIKGYEDGSFRPNQNISRAQMATFMFRYLNSIHYVFGEVTPVDFDDADQIAGAYKDAVDVIVSLGIMKGTSETTFAPNRAANRGMCATVMLRMFNLLH